MPTFKFKIDENLPAEIADSLRGAGFDAIGVVQQGLAGRPDRDVLAVVSAEGRAFLTFDLDFADTRVYPPAEYSGLVVFRLVRQDTPYVLAVLQKLLSILMYEDPAGRLWIVEETQIRIRA